MALREGRVWDVALMGVVDRVVAVRDLRGQRDGEKEGGVGGMGWDGGL